MQRNWIGKSTGCEIEFDLPSSTSIKVYTTRPDTLMGATYLAIAPEHNLSIELADNNQQLKNLLKSAKKQVALKLKLALRKKGIFSGVLCSSPIN